MIIHRQKEFGAHERKAKRRAAVKEQNEVMHANRAEKKVKKAEEAVKKGTESAEVIDAQLNNANRLAKGTPVQEEVAKKVEEVAKENTALKTTVRRGAKKAEKFVKNHPGAVALGATGLAAAGAVGGMVAKKNKEEKRKVFSVAKDENGEEKMFSVTEKHFSKMEDEDYIEKQENKKKSVKHAKAKHAAGGATLGTVAGALGGAKLGSLAKNPKGAAIGAVTGAVVAGTTGGVLGHKVGKKVKEEVEKDADNKVKRYKKASEHDKKFLREKENREEAEKLEKEKLKEMKKQTSAQRMTAWNTL